MQCSWSGSHLPQQKFSSTESVTFKCSSTSFLFTLPNGSSFVPSKSQTRALPPPPPENKQQQNNREVLRLHMFLTPSINSRLLSMMKTVAENSGMTTGPLTGWATTANTSLSNSSSPSSEMFTTAHWNLTSALQGEVRG